MTLPTRELAFDLVVFLVAGLAHASVMLGLGVDPIPTLVVGSVVVAGAVLTFVPARSRIPAAVTGILGVALAGFVVPVYATRAVRPGETLALALLLAGVVLMLTFALIRITAFASQSAQST